MVAPGSVVVESDRKVVQHLEGGIVQNLLVTAILMSRKVRSCCGSIRPRSGPRKEIARSAVYSAVAEEARLQAESEGKDSITFPTELLQKSPDPNAIRAMGDQKRRFDERRAARKIEISILEERIAQAQRQIQGNTAQNKGARAQFDSVSQE